MSEQSNITVCVQIGNSDDKLTQAQWATYCLAVSNLCDDHGTVHFAGGPPTQAQWQNFCVVVEVPWDKTELLASRLEELRGQYNQDSVAWLSGETFFI